MTSHLTQTRRSQVLSASSPERATADPAAPARSSRGLFDRLSAGFATGAWSDDAAYERLVQARNANVQNTLLDLGTRSNSAQIRHQTSVAASMLRNYRHVPKVAELALSTIRSIPYMNVRMKDQRANAASAVTALLEDPTMSPELVGSGLMALASAVGAINTAEPEGRAHFDRIVDIMKSRADEPAIVQGGFRALMNTVRDLDYHGGAGAELLDAMYGTDTADPVWDLDDPQTQAGRLSYLWALRTHLPSPFVHRIGESGDYGRLASLAVSGDGVAWRASQMLRECAWRDASVPAMALDGVAETLSTALGRAPARQTEDIAATLQMLSGNSGTTTSGHVAIFAAEDDLVPLHRLVERQGADALQRRNGHGLTAFETAAADEETAAFALIGMHRLRLPEGLALQGRELDAYTNGRERGVALRRAKTTAIADSAELDMDTAGLVAEFAGVVNFGDVIDLERDLDGFRSNGS